MNTEQPKPDWSGSTQDKPDWWPECPWVKGDYQPTLALEDRVEYMRIGWREAERAILERLKERGIEL